MAYRSDPIFGPSPTAPTAVIPVGMSGAPYGGPYTKAVPLTPGTPLPAGRAVFLKATGTVQLKLTDGGTIPAGDPTGGAGTLIHGFAAIDADTSASPGASISILY